MEGFARYRLGIAHLLCQEYEDAQSQLVSALEQLTLDEDKDYLLIASIVKYFNGRIDFTCLEIIEFLSSNPEIARLNSSVKRK
jgi:spore coat polysaccharide biosynthesis protein SpsF (cytidylyltransferase family)